MKQWLAIVLLGSGLSVLPTHPTQAQEEEQQIENAATVLVTGSNRGIGLEFVRQYAELGWRVIATCRNPDLAINLRNVAAGANDVIIERLDITNPVEIDALAQKYAGQPIDILLNNAAQLGQQANQVLGQIDYDEFLRLVSVNVIGTLRVTEAFLPNIEASNQKKIITMGSSAGSIGMLSAPTDYYAYRSSKAALHLLMRNIALDVADRGIIVGLLNPGLVDTRGILRMADSGEEVPEELRQVIEMIRSGAVQLTPPRDAVSQMITLTENLTPNQSGTFLNADGRILPW